MRDWTLEATATTDGPTLLEALESYINAHGTCSTKHLHSTFPQHSKSLGQALHKLKDAGKIAHLSKGVYGPIGPESDPAPAPIRPNPQGPGPREKIIKAFGFFRRGVREGYLSQAEAEQGLWTSVDRIVCEAVT